MGFKDLKTEFDKLTPADVYDITYSVQDEGLRQSMQRSESAERNYRYWLLKLLFEIHGDMDFIAARMREQALATKALADSYDELVKMQKEKKNGER